jgi:hypothetical protein
MYGVLSVVMLRSQISKILPLDRTLTTNVHFKLMFTLNTTVILD